MRFHIVAAGVVSVVTVLAACVGSSESTQPAVDPDGGSGGPEGGGGGSDGSQNDANPCGQPLSPCDGKCVNLDESGEHCGACGHSCLGGACSAGKCAPVKLVGGLGSPTALALSASPPLAIMAADTALYKCAKSGCSAAERMWTATDYPPKGDVIDIALTSSDAYVVTEVPAAQVRVSRAPLDRVVATPGPLSTTGVSTTSASLVIDDTRVVVSANSQVVTCLTTGCTYETVFSGLYVGSSTLTPGAGGFFVWGGGKAGIDGVNKCPRSDGLPCTPQSLVTRAKSGSVYHIQVVNDVVYWVDMGSTGEKHRVLACALAGCNDTPKIIADQEEDIGGLVVDSKAAYFTTTLANTIRFCDNLATGCGTAAKTLVASQTKPTGIALDAEAIYWVNQGAAPNTGELMKLAR